ncbi:MAG: SIS domain-containing protein [Phycisphaerales bacterium]|nr:SIS domain-containing protein [Phycisphaerales bacterium]
MNQATHSEVVQQEFAQAAELASAFCSDATNAERVTELSELIARKIESGGKVLAIGNGGSCADAIHFCEELTGRYREDRPSIPAIACADPGHITCTANDYGFDRVFSRWVEGLGTSEDVLVAMSTSGNSENILRAVERAREKEMQVVTLLGKDGGKLKGRGDVEFVVPGKTADRIQELHMLILHALVGAIERSLGY